MKTYKHDVSSKQSKDEELKLTFTIGFYLWSRYYVVSGDIVKSRPHEF